MRYPPLIAAVALLAVLSTGPSAVADQPPGDISGNVEFLANIPEMRTAIAINFLGDTMFVSTVHGVYSYDVSDPAAPRRLGALPMYIWENEDMDLDAKRKLLFISRDPRGFTTQFTPGSFPYGAVHIVDVSDPRTLRQVSVFPVPAGHTTTCINSCRYVWTSGPARGVQQPSDWGGRPIFATDIADPNDPKPCPEPIDTGRNDGKTDYVHDVQVDGRGIAWVSGRGGVRGYVTSGKHRNPVTGKVETATGCEPIPYAGGGSPETATPSRFMHNSWRNVSARAERSAAPGTVLYATEESFSPCGRFVTYDLRGSFDGEGWRNIDKTQFRLTALDTWTPEGQPGSTGCASAHYFEDRGDSVLAYAFYQQGTRFLDASDPSDIRQIGFYRPDRGRAWAAYWHRGAVYVADFDRGIDILRFKGGTKSATVEARAESAATAGALEMDPDAGYLCPLPAAAPSRSSAGAPPP